MFATYLLANYFYFRVLGCANLFKLASTSQFAETDQNNQREQDASRDALRRWARRPGGLDRDANCVLPSTQTDKDGPFTSAGCVGPLEMPL
jgi:hypothetical protein